VSGDERYTCGAEETAVIGSSEAPAGLLLRGGEYGGGAGTTTILLS
jgi:hypothetical protein